MTNPYATNKLAYHGPLWWDLRAGIMPPGPHTVHLMPELRCQQSCQWCAYGHRIPGDTDAPRRNEELMPLRKHEGGVRGGERDFLPWALAEPLLADLCAMGTRAVEITGGGEPLIWQHIEEWLDAQARTSLQLALVTNGVAMTTGLADLIAACDWRWARVSIDAGTPEAYRAIRRTPSAHWGRAWNAVRLLAERRDQAERRDIAVGVGFVVCDATAHTIEAAVECAVSAGADNIRFSAPVGLGDGGAGLSPNHLCVAQAQLATARERWGASIRIIDLVSERATLSPVQGYVRCITQQVLCVIGGDGGIYPCCSQAFTKRGLRGSLWDGRLRDLWPAIREVQAKHDARVECREPCMYEQRNKAMLDVIANPAETPAHLDYI